MAWPASLDILPVAASMFSNKNLAGTLNGFHDATTTTINTNEDPALLGAAASNGIAVIEDEHVFYTTRDSANKRLTGCTRAYGGTVAAAHASGLAVRFLAVHSFINELAAAIGNIENDLAPAGVRKYLRTVDGLAQTIDGIKTFTGTIRLGTNPALTGFLGLPNAQAIFGRNAANNADKSMVRVNATDQVELAAAGVDTKIAGKLLLSADPTDALGAVTKQMVDLKMDKNGGIMTGFLTLNADPTAALHAATKQYADLKVAKAGDSMTGLLDVGIDDAAAAAVTTIAKLRHTTSGTPAAGIGGRLLLESESADENPSAVAAMDWVLDDVTAGSEDGSFRFLLRQAGAAALVEAMRLTSLLVLGVGTTSPIANADVPIQVNVPTSQARYFGVNKNGGYGLLLGFDHGLLGVAAGIIRMVTTDPLSLVVNSTTEAMRIFSTGGVFIGGTPADPGANNLRVQGSVGIAVTPLARLHVQEQTLGNEVLRLESVAPNDDPNLRVFQNRAATTDATATTLQTLAITAGNTYLVEARVAARRTGGTGGTADDGAVYIRRAMATTKAGTVTLNPAAPGQDGLTAEDQAAWDCQLKVSGTNVIVEVTGAANNNITWHSTLLVQNLSM